MTKLALGRVLAALGLVVVSLAYLIERILAFSDQSSIDFRHTWVAAQMWVGGANPYSSDFARVGAESFSSGDLPRIWVYPPNWFFLVTPFDLFGDVTGSIIWNVANTILLVLGCWLLSGIAVDGLPSLPEWSRKLLQTDRPDVDRFVLFAVHLAFVTFIQGTAISLTTGQSGVVAFFALTLLMWAIVQDRRAWGVFAIVLLMLKPQVGVIICVGLLFDKRNWSMVAKAAVVTVLSALPAFITTRPRDLLDGMFDNWDELYSLDYGPTNADRISGIRNLADWAGFGDIGVQVGVVLAILAVIGLELLRRNAVLVGDFVGDESLANVLYPTAAILAFVSLQTYDLPMIGVLVMVALSARGVRLVLFSVAFGLIYRSQNVSELVGADALTSGRLEAIGGLLVLIVVAGLLTQKVLRSPVVERAT